MSATGRRFGFCRRSTKIEGRISAIHTGGKDMTWMTKLLCVRTGSSRIFSQVVGVSIIMIMMSGCAASPKSSHSLVRSDADLQDNFLETYALEESLVTIQSTETGEGDQKKANVTGTFDRQEHDGPRLALGADKRLGVRTHVTIEKFDNTDIPKKVSVKVDDQRSELIKKTGEFAIQAIKLAGYASASEAPDPPIITLPLRINLSRLIGKTDPGQTSTSAAQPAKHDVPGRVDSPLVEFSAIPKDAVPIKYLDNARTDGFFYYAACRSARVRFLAIIYFT